MDAILSFLHALPDVGLATLALGLAGSLGLLVGELNWRGVGLGVGGVLFAGIFIGHGAHLAELEFDAHSLEFVREFGLILFVFTIGIQVGPGFFASLQRSGLQLNAIAAAIVLLGVGVTTALHFLFSIDVPVLVGLMSGAVTNTPGLGAATQVLKDVGASPEQMAQPSLGYAMAYPFGILGILISMVTLRAVLRVDTKAEEEAFDASRNKGAAKLPSKNIKICNENLEGVKLGDIPGLFDDGVVASRMRSQGELVTPTRETLVHLGDILHLVGEREHLEGMRLVLGEEVPEHLTTTKGTRMKWRRMVVTERGAVGKRIRELDLESRAVTISRISRAGTELHPHGALTLQFGDIINVVGTPDGIDSIKCLIGDQGRKLMSVQYSAVFIGIVLGVLVGSIPILVPGLPAPLKLGLAGGPLVTAIVLARVGSFGPFVFFMPPVANQALREFGIILFLGAVGLKAGDKFVDTLTAGDGLVWMALAATITLLPLLIVGFVTRVFFKINYLSLTGVLAGSMTDPPALAFANAMSPTCSAQSLGYASVYPLVMCLRILAPQVLVLLLL